ncbi:MAG: hypothetical protein ABIK89_12125 [Planctomycetota bacterium]
MGLSPSQTAAQLRELGPRRLLCETGRIADHLIPDPTNRIHPSGVLAPLSEQPEVREGHVNHLDETLSFHPSALPLPNDRDNGAATTDVTTGNHA